MITLIRGSVCSSIFIHPPPRYCVQSTKVTVLAAKQSIQRIRNDTVFSLNCSLGWPLPETNRACSRFREYPRVINSMSEESLSNVFVRGRAHEIIIILFYRIAKSGFPPLYVPNHGSGSMPQVKLWPLLLVLLLRGDYYSITMSSLLGLRKHSCLVFENYCAKQSPPVSSLLPFA